MLQKFGIGTDIVKTERFQNKPYSRHKRFYEKIFLDSEIEYCLKHKNNAVHFSGKFAMKESVKKSINKNIDFLDIETYYSDAKPKIKLKNNQNFEFLVSLSHENEFAIATVVSENINKK
jgi:holo-[acyl-carrier-protein] synthase|tara:strand:- start:10505 stop:10861 length:357 start_codon:yes stop_codon:yes gene_type:complete